MESNLSSLLRQSNLFDENERVVLGLSGGVDSMVLFHLLHELGLDIIAAHVNYNRRATAKREARELEKITSRFDVPFECFDVKDPIEGNFQEEARRIRFSFFEKVAKKHRVQKVVLGHHLNDQIETFIMRLVKGGSFDTLKGMASVEPFNDIKLVRPFLDIEKEAIENYALDNDIPYFHDISNDNLTYTRNRFRNRIIPFSEKENPNFSEAMKRFFKDLRSATGLLEDHVEGLLERHPGPIPVEEFLAWPPLFQRIAIKTLFRNVSEDLHLSQGMYEEIVNQLQSGKNFRLPLDEDIFLYKEYDGFFVAKAKERTPLVVSITGEGTYPVDGHRHFRVTSRKNAHIPSKCFELWYNGSVFPLYVRTRREGDRIELPYGRKKIKDLFIDLKVPPHQRDDILLLTDDEKVLWIPDLDIECHQEKTGDILYVEDVLAASPDGCIKS